MRFVISCYGSLYVPLLAVCLRSIRLTHPRDRVVVLYDDMDPKAIQVLERQNPAAKFIEHSTIGANFRTDKQRIPGKLDHWGNVLDLDPGADGETTIFLDADMVVYRPLAALLPPRFDAMFTWREHVWPINTGYFAVQESNRIRTFMREWGRRTREIYLDGKLLKTAMRKSGGGDQYSLWELMGRPDVVPRGHLRADFPFGSIDFVGAPCAVFNQTNPVPVDSGTAIFHFKGEWHYILVRGKKWWKFHSWKKSGERYRLWHSYLASEEAEAHYRFLPRWTRIKNLTLAAGLPF